MQPDLVISNRELHFMACRIIAAGMKELGTDERRC